MPKYYHIVRGKKSSGVDKKFINGKPLYFSKKDVGWNSIEKEISRDYGGYHEYEIFIPPKIYTTSFNPTSKNKIVKISTKNAKEYYDLRKKYGGSFQFIEEMKKRNIIGIDATSDIMYKYMWGGPPEGFIWKKISGIKICHVDYVLYT